MSGPPGGTRYLCPFDCGWSYDEPASFDVHRKAAETEAALREHLTEHTARVMLSEGRP